jgi:beta-lactamase superfamily II metal-dependent hydrolase
MDKLRVRLYNVGFGDAILVRFPERVAPGKETTRHVLIDLGNLPGAVGGGDAALAAVVDDVLAELGGAAVDLYVMTHDHLDHVRGLLHAHKELGKTIPVDYAWLTAPARPGYYDEARHEVAHKRLQQTRAAHEAIARFLGRAPHAAAAAAPLAAVASNNDARATERCVSYLRSVAKLKTTYVHRGCDVTATHPFVEARLRVWAPEEDTAGYFGSFQPMALGMGVAGPAGAATRKATAGGAAEGTEGTATPPAGVDASAFYGLIEQRAAGVVDNLLAIDRSANDTSVVFSLEWRGWTLLFAGDAELRSWQTMEKQGQLAPVHFLKVSQHGGPNGTPGAKLLERILPATRPDERRRRAAVSTCRDTYHGVPDDEALAALRARCDEVKTTDGLAGGASIELEFDG